MTPSPVVDEETRNRIGDLAVKAAKAVGYENLGTAEFLRLDDGTFYFIEINARLQVEHPITELVSGLDLVKLQLDIANGEKLPFKQEDLKMNGHAIECRINAEDTFADFAPSTGPVPDLQVQECVSSAIGVLKYRIWMSVERSRCKIPVFLNVLYKCFNAVYVKITQGCNHTQTRLIKSLPPRAELCHERIIKR